MSSNYYRDYAEMMLRADEETRSASIEHWTRCNKDNIEANRSDLVCFSSKMLGIAEAVEAVSEALNKAIEQRAEAEASHLLEALDVLDVQYEHIRNFELSAARENQNAYYEGARLMLEVMAGYGVDIQRDEETGKHRAIRRAK